MKVQVPIEETIARALASRYDLDKLQNSLDSTYNDPAVLKVIEEKAGIKTATVRDKKNLFNSAHGLSFKMEGKLSDPLRMIGWLVNWGAFVKKNGAPAGEVSAETLPANLVFWLETTHLRDEFKPKGTRSNPNLGETRESAKEREIREGKAALEETRRQVEEKEKSAKGNRQNTPATTAAK